MTLSSSVSSVPNSPTIATVTVVIPVYNRRALLIEALESVVGQTFGDWRVMVVDNGSTDGGAEAAEGLGHPCISVFRQIRQGPSGGRNAGILRAESPWVAFLDSDDLWKPDHLATVMGVAARMPEAGWIATCGELFGARTESGGQDDGTAPRLTPAPDPQQTPAERFLRSGNYLATPTVLCRRQALLETGLFDPALARSEDTDLWLRLSLRYPCAHLDKVTVRVREHVAMTTQPEPRTAKLRRRVYLLMKALACMEASHARLLPLARERLRVTWRELAAEHLRRGERAEAQFALRRQWELRPLDPVPLLRGAWMSLGGGR